MAFTFADFLDWERASRDIIDVKRAYVDMAGSLDAGVMLSQIIWHYCCSRHDRVRVVKENHVWLRIEREDWWKECRVTDRQADRLLGVLKGRGLVVVKKFRVNGAPRCHVRIEEHGFLSAWQTVTARGYVSRPPSPLVIDKTDLTESLFAEEVQDPSASGVQDIGSWENADVQDAEKGAQGAPVFTKRGNQNSPNGENVFPKRGNQNSPNGENVFPKRGNQNSPNGEIYPYLKSPEKDNNKEASADAENAVEKEAACAARVVVVTLLTQNAVHEDKACELAEAGLTEQQARQEIADLDSRTITTNRGGMLFKACRAALQGKAWGAPSAERPKKKRWIVPPSTASDTPITGATPDVKTIRNNIKGKTGLAPRPAPKK